MTRMFTSTRHKSSMTAQRKKVKSTAANDSLVPEHFSREETMSAEHARAPRWSGATPPDRRLRNRIIIANVIAWVVIIVLIGLIFF